MSAPTRWELVAYALSALLLLSSMIVLPVVRAVDPVLAVAINYAGDSSIRDRAAALTFGRDDPMTVEILGAPDPWGRPWHVHYTVPYSVGPDGLDAECGGDDVPAFKAYAHPLRAWTPEEVLGWPRLTLVIAGITLAAWTLLTYHVIRAPRNGLFVEALRAAFIAAVPATAGFLWVFAGIPGLEMKFAQSASGGLLQVPASTAIPLTWALVCYLPALAWRLTRPRGTALT